MKSLRKDCSSQLYFILTLLHSEILCGLLKPIIDETGPFLDLLVFASQHSHISRNLEMRRLLRKICSHLQISGYVTLLLLLNT